MIKCKFIELFIERCAPIQISYLGFPGTTGSGCIDYLIADRMIIPDQNKKHYSEKIIYLPNTYQVNDSTLNISEKKFSRKLEPVYKAIEITRNELDKKKSLISFECHKE